jgi:hypothetical protein
MAVNVFLARYPTWESSCVRFRDAAGATGSGSEEEGTAAFSFGTSTTGRFGV